MAKVLLYFLFVFLTCHIHWAVYGVKIFDIKSVEKCPVEDPIDGDVQLITNDKGEKSFNMRLNINYDLDENYKAILKTYYLKNGNWVVHQDYDDPWCELVLKVSQLWAVVKSATQPALPDGCNLAAGEYVMKDLQLKESDVSSYTIIFGEGSYKGNLFLRDDENKDIFCLTIECDVKEK
ncbi:uncharacterized protein LOC108907419 [Anoplophora glabripennis]|uniref:uncharacterized protein LOC108907419 n=1 Tax=Anoplophora glabripennis TaxID=217634 RepID=UPI00087439E8|nr:uncharacterized protein LOC108907419 [Anoplophora glabripennis]